MLSLKQKKQQEAYYNNIETVTVPPSKPPVENVTKNLGNTYK